MDDPLRKPHPVRQYQHKLLAIPFLWIWKVAFAMIGGCMDPKKQKIIDDLAKIADTKDSLKRRLAALDEREKQKQQKLVALNNTEILGLVASYCMTPEELADFLLEKKGAPIINKREEAPADDNDEET
jgi:hypothetical protein